MFINNIKQKYYNNLLDKLIRAEDLGQVKIKLRELADSDNHNYQSIALKYLFILLEKDKFKKIFDQNIIWINSFNISDTDYLNKFINFILNKNKIISELPNSYAFYLNQAVKKINKNYLSFSEIVDFAYLYQYLISKNMDGLKIINSSGAFFETNLKRYFTHFNFTKAYFYVVRNPLNIFALRKYENPKADANEHFYGLLSSDTDYIKKYNFNDNTIEENTQNWSTNVSSWANPNVTSTFRGFIIKYENLLEDPKQILAEVIGHLVQSGLKIALNYEHIDEFLSKNLLDKNEVDFSNISNKELKLLRRDLGNISQKFGYEI